MLAVLQLQAFSDTEIAGCLQSSVSCDSHLSCLSDKSTPATT